MDSFPLKFNPFLRHSRVRPDADALGKNELAKAIFDGDKDKIRAILAKAPNLALLLQRELEPGVQQPYMNVFYALLAHAPDVAKDQLDRLMRESGSCDTGQHKLNYAFLDNIYIPNRSRLFSGSAVSPSNGHVGGDPRLVAKKPYNVKPFTSNLYRMVNKHCLAFMAKNDQEALLKHPIVRMMLRRKWHIYRWIFYIGFLVWCIFMCSLVAVISLQNHPAFIDNGVDLAEQAGDCSLTNGSCCKQYRAIYSDWHKDVDTIDNFQIIISIVLAINFMSEYYFLNVERLLTLITNILVVFLLFDFDENVVPQACYPAEELNRVIFIHKKWQWETSVIGIAFAWTTLVFYIRKIPHSGIYVIMFLDLFKKFLKLSLILFFCLGAFGSVFLMLFPHKCPFQNFFWSILSTLVMTAGEYSYEAIVCSDPANDPLLSPWLLQIALGAVIFIMYFVVLNMLIGLAVDDIKLIQEKALFQKLRLRASVVLDYEISMPFVLLRKFLEFEDVVSCDDFGCAERKRELIIGDTAGELDKINCRLGHIIDLFEKKIDSMENRMTDMSNQLECIERLVLRPNTMNGKSRPRPRISGDLFRSETDQGIYDGELGPRTLSC